MQVTKQINMATTIPNHSVLPITEADIPTIGVFVAASKLPLTINRLLYKDWPNHAAQLVQSTSAVERSFNNPDSEGFKLVENGTGSVVGHLFLTCKKPAPAEEAAGQPSVPDGMVPELFALVRQSTVELDEPVKDREYLEITHMYVIPTRRGKGLSSGLVKLGLEKGKQAGIPVFLSSVPQRVELYRGLGFKETGHVDWDLSKYAPPHCGFGTFRLSGMIFEG